MTANRAWRMRINMKAVAKLIAMILGNTAAIGFGIGLFEGKQGYVVMATVLAFVACLVEWESEK